MKKADLAVIGMGVMGSNLALNFADHGFRTVVYNRTTSVAEEVVAANPAQQLILARTLEELVEKLEKPRVILLMVKAGAAVDAILDSLGGLVEPGDILVDCGNSYFKDTQRRFQTWSGRGLHFVGLGVSGGETGARLGPAMMPGCSPEAWARIRPMVEAIAAKAGDGTPCVGYLGEGGSGHYVKMVHNGIEYADMQIIAEIYDVLRTVGGKSVPEISELFREWNEGHLASYLLEITERILRTREAKGFLLDSILDVARQKGTGKWTNLEAVDLGVDASVLAAGLNARVMSMLLEERGEAEKAFPAEAGRRNSGGCPVCGGSDFEGAAGRELVEFAKQALLAGRILAYAQGFVLYRAANEAYGWKLPFGEIARIFRAGCIIRSALLEPMREAYAENPELPNLIMAPQLRAWLQESVPGLRQLVRLAVARGIAVPALAAAVSYFDSYTRGASAANLIQAQRDYFGAHTYERRGEAGVFHNEGWEDEAQADGKLLAREVRHD